MVICKFNIAFIRQSVTCMLRIPPYKIRCSGNLVVTGVDEGLGAVGVVVEVGLGCWAGLGALFSIFSLAIFLCLYV